MRKTFIHEKHESHEKKKVGNFVSFVFLRVIAQGQYPCENHFVDTVWHLK